MLKVSFEKDGNIPIKEVQTFNDKVTIVALHGIVRLPEFLRCIPKKIHDWMYTCQNVGVYPEIFNLYVTSTGKAKRADGDTHNPILAERIAESRAKMYMYKFMRDFCQKLMGYYNTVVFGKAVTTTTLKHNDNTVYSALWKYRELYYKEKQHLATLIHESDTESSPNH